MDYCIIVQVDQDVPLAPHVAPDLSSDDDWEELLISNMLHNQAIQLHQMTTPRLLPKEIFWEYFGLLKEKVRSPSPISRSLL